MLSSHANYRELLKTEFGNRRLRNASYSLRAFARDLDVAYSRVNEVINGKRGLSRRNAHKIARKLGLSESERKMFILDVESHHSRSKVFREVATNKLASIHAQQDRNQLQMDVFQTISNWYYYALLELTYLQEFKSDSEWIAKRLGISKIETELAIERMLRLGLLEEANNILKARDDFTMSPSGIPSQSIKQHHEQILNKAKDAVYLQEIETRDLSAITMAIDSSQLPKAKELIKKFRREFNAIMGEATSKDAVYCLAVQFFRFDQQAQLQAEKSHQENTHD